MDMASILYKALCITIIINQNISHACLKEGTDLPDRYGSTVEKYITDLPRTPKRNGAVNAVRSTGFKSPMGPTVVLALDGSDGRDGQPGQDGKRGQDGEPGQDGQPGQPGQDGQPGQNGQPGKKGQDGANGKSGKADVPKDKRDEQGTKDGTSGTITSDQKLDKPGNSPYLIAIVVVLGIILGLTDVAVVGIMIYLRKVMRSIEVKESEKRYDDLQHRKINGRYETYRATESTHSYQEPHNYIDVIADSTGN